LEDKGEGRITVRRDLGKCVLREESVWNWLIVMVSSGVRASDLLPWN
jgi:hypothetical protein